jgi:hypothetical protein
MNSGDRLCLVLSCLVRYPLLYLCHLHFGTAIPSEKNSFFISYSPNFDRSKCVYTQVSVGCTSFSGFSYRNTVRLEGIGGSIERGERGARKAAQLRLAITHPLCIPIRFQMESRRSIRLATRDKFGDKKNCGISNWLEKLPHCCAAVLLCSSKS